ncbi:MAG: hypothetical protein IPH10_08825 [bacterium]|nr:hypothetical protein [bacterium]
MGIKSRIVAANTLMIGILLIGFVAVTYTNIRHSGLRKLDAELAIFAAKVSEDVAQDIEDHEETDFAEVRDFAPDGLAEGAGTGVDS